MAFTVEALASKPFVQKALSHPLQVYSVLSFFFGVDLPEHHRTLQENGGATVSQRMDALWYGGGPTYDALCQPFAETIRMVGRSYTTDIQQPLSAEWNESVDGKVAQLILTDQLSRNIFRGTPEAFGYEDISLQLARSLGSECRKEKPDLTGEFYPPYLSFVATGLMHSEDLNDLNACIDVLHHCKARFPEMENGWNFQLQFLNDHKAVVERFGRYPHRNKLKNRPSTPEEEEWLNDKDNLPGWAKSQG